jgi:small subunit ribosomal protein S7
MRWVIESARKRGENSMGRARCRAARSFRRSRWRVKKREEVHRMAEANKAFSHYRW